MDSGGSVTLHRSVLTEILEDKTQFHLLMLMDPMVGRRWRWQESRCKQNPRKPPSPTSGVGDNWTWPCFYKHRSHRCAVSRFHLVCSIGSAFLDLDLFLVLGWGHAMGNWQCQCSNVQCSTGSSLLKSLDLFLGLGWGYMWWVTDTVSVELFFRKGKWG